MQSNTGESCKKIPFKALYYMEKWDFLWKSMWEMWITFPWDNLWKTQKIGKIRCTATAL